MTRLDIIQSDVLVARCDALKQEGSRLVQVSCTQTAMGMELTYSFDKNYELVNLRTYWSEGETIPSIQSVYDCAFIYENEIVELFGVVISGMAVDFSGKLYKTAVEKPFCSGITIKEV